MYSGYHCVTFRCKSLTALDTHLSLHQSAGPDKADKENALVQYKTLPNYHSFLEWKAEEEKRTKSSFVQKCGTKRSKSAEITHFYCNRDGQYRSKGHGTRMVKFKGTNKLGTPCTAYLKCTKDTDTEMVSVEYCTVHSHETQIGHLRLTNDLRASVATKLQMGVPLDIILDEVRNNVSCVLGREHLITKQDIRNIGTQYNVDGVQKHTNDALSVKVWVEELTNSSDYNPILLYKMQGMLTDELPTLEKDDFVLAVQTKFQFEMLKKFGNDTVCIDSTHQTNHYSYLLNTLMVIDEYGEGIPVAFLISNRESSDVISVFFSSIKYRIGQLEPAVFMTDDAPQYFSSWVNISGQSSNTKKLLCRWHIDRTWRKAVKEKVVEAEHKVTVYHHLLVLLNESNVTEFNKKLQSFLSWLNEQGITDFLEYFQSHYCNRVGEWATHNRQHTSVNTNMHIEAFHRLVKTVYFHQKQNRRVDCLINVLLKVARDKAFERLLKMENGKVTYRQSEINKRHKNAEKLVDSKITNISDTCFSVGTQATSYTVQQQKVCSCPLRCSFCGVCAHMYTCTCLDNLLHSTPCKHIHLIHCDRSAHLKVTVGPDVSTMEETRFNADVLQTDANHVDMQTESGVDDTCITPLQQLHTNTMHIPSTLNSSSHNSDQHSHNKEAVAVQQLHLPGSGYNACESAVQTCPADNRHYSENCKHQSFHY